MRQKAYIKGNKSFLGTITLESGERFNFIGGQRFLYLMFPFLQWVMPVYCWKESDDVNQNSNISWPSVVLLICLIPLTRNWGVGFPLPFYIPPILSFSIAIIIGIIFIKYMSHKFMVPQNTTLYKVQIHPGKRGAFVLLVTILVSLPEIIAIWAILTMPSDFIGPYMLFVCIPLFSYAGNLSALSLRECSVEFLEKVEN